MLNPVPLGLLGVAVVFDLIDARGGDDGFGQAADRMIAAGILTGSTTAVFGGTPRTIPDPRRWHWK